MKQKRNMRDGIPYVREHTVTAIMKTPDEFMPPFIKRMFCIFIKEIAPDDLILKWGSDGAGMDNMIDDMMVYYDAIYAIYVTRFGEVQS